MKATAERRIEAIEARPRAGSEVHRDRDVKCARCGHKMAAEAWPTLPLERTLTRAEVSAYVSEWPVHDVVEVRRCAGCGGSIARRRGRER